jgi:hypothetical protein
MKRRQSRRAPAPAPQEATRERSTLTTAELLQRGLGPALPKRAELLAIPGLHADMQVLIGGPDRSYLSGVEEVWLDYPGDPLPLLASSRKGASFVLCRALLELGCPDVALHVFRCSDSRHQYTLKSIHKAATRTIVEGERQWAREAEWVEDPRFAEAGKKRRHTLVERRLPTPQYVEPPLPRSALQQASRHNERAPKSGLAQPGSPRAGAREDR